MSEHGSRDAAAHYFAPAPDTPELRRHIEFSVAGRTLRLVTSSGVFSGDRLDPGTAVLLRKAPLPSGPGVHLDLGCGYGPIACSLALSSPDATVYAVDVNRRALELARRNADILEVAGRLVVASPDDVPEDLRFDGIWSNPPIRIGKPALHRLLERWLPRLAPGGTAWLVVARNLGGDSLAGWLQAKGWRVDRYASQKGYRVLRVDRHPADSGPGTETRGLSP